MPRLVTWLGAAFLAMLPLLACTHEHAFLLGAAPNPAMLGYLPVPLNASYSSVELVVEGDVAAYLNGTFYRGAPGAWPDGWWLDGLITLNAFHFSQGSVRYTMQWNKDEAYNRAVAGTQPLPPLDKGPVEGAIPHPANSSWPTGVAFRQVQGQVLGSTGVSNHNSFNSKTLAPLEMPFAYSDDLGAPFLAPTHEQTIDGEVLHHLVTGMQSGSGGVPSYIVYRIRPGTRTREVIAKIEKPTESSPFKGYPSFQHMPLATPDHYIMVEAPCYYPDTVTDVGSVDWTGWRSNILAGGHVRLVSRATGESLVYPLSHSVFAIHHINAFHDAASNSVVIDTIQLFPSVVPCAEAFKNLKMKNYVDDWKMTGFGLSMSKMVRLTVPLDKPGAQVTPEALTDVRGIEFPTISYDVHNGRPYRFVYGCWMSTSGAPYYNALIKVDVQSGERHSWAVEGHYPREPIFVPRPNGDAEDDGVVITDVLDTVKKESYLLILDAKTMRQVGRAGPTPHAIPHGFHGRYFDRSLNGPKKETLELVV